MADVPSRLDPASSQEVMNRIYAHLRYAKAFWRPLNARQDYWATLYRMLDPIQQAKPLGYRRFISNEPRTAVDSAIAILTRNEVRWSVDLLGSEDEFDNVRRTAGRIERTLNGINYDIDELFSSRGLPPMWRQVAFQALLRGWVWGKFHVTSEALKYRRSPFVPEIWDSRTVYPHFDSWGLNHVIVEKLTNLGDLMATYPELFADWWEKPGFNMNTPAMKIEFWSNDRGERKGIMACMASIGTTATGTPYQLFDDPRGAWSRWLIEPFFHGYPPDALPVVGVPANGLYMPATPPLSSMLERTLTERADLLALRALEWQGPGSWVADTGRSILSTVEEQVPQYNELVATIFQHFSIGTYGTWVFKTPTGELPDFEPGIEAKVALTPQESVQRLEPTPINNDAYRLVQLLQDERQKGVLSNILQASGPIPETGVVFQQITNAALNALDPYQDAMKRFGTAMATSILTQLQMAADLIKPFEMVVPSQKATYWRIEFDPKKDLDQQRRYRPIPVMKPALPDDLVVRLTAARQALDPRRPLLSLYTVMETLLRPMVDDPDLEMDRIFEDIAQTDPIIVMEQIAQALERRGEQEMAARIRENEFKAALAEDLRLRQITGNLPQPPGRTPLPPPEAGGGAINTQRQPAGAEPEIEMEGAQALGAIGASLRA